MAEDDPPKDAPAPAAAAPRLGTFNIAAHVATWPQWAFLEEALYGRQNRPHS